MPAIQSLTRLTHFGVFELDAHSGELRKQGVKVKLQEQPFQILQVLTERPGELVTREELQKRIWTADTFVDFDKGLYNAVKKLREALGDEAGTPRYIETVPKRGYRFIAPLNGNGHAKLTVVQPLPTSIAASLSSSAVSSKASYRAPKLRVVLLLLAVAAASLALRSSAARHPEQKRVIVERQLTANPPENVVTAAAISRDGKFLAYTDLSNQLHLLGIDSGETRQLPLPGPYSVIDWFPDGTNLLLTSGLGVGDLWKMSTWDSSLRKLWGGIASAASLSPDGSHIAFVKDHQELWLMGGDGEEPHKILASDFPEYEGVTWSPTGRRLAYLRSRGTFEKHDVTIETCDLAGGTHTTVLSDPHLWSINGFSGITWLPPGRIVYSVNADGTQANLWAIKVDPNTGRQTGDATPLAGWKNFRALDPRASADGKRLIAGREYTESRIYLGDLAAGNKAFTPLRFTPDSWYNWIADWTKDSKAILFTSTRDGKSAILEQKVDSQTPETLITGSEFYSRPKLTAEGNLLFTVKSTSFPATYRLMSTPEHGGTRSTLMMGKYTYTCGSTPLSSCVVAELKDKRLAFFRLDPMIGKGEQLASIGGYLGFEPRWDLSPDGTRIAIVDPYWGNGEIRIVDLADQKTTVLPVRNWRWQWLAEVSWAADGQGLFALAQSTSSVALISLDAKGKAKVLQEMPSGATWVSSIVPSPDGRSLAFTKRIYREDVMLLENP